MVARQVQASRARTSHHDQFARSETLKSARKWDHLRTLPRHYWHRDLDFPGGVRLGVPTLSPIPGRLTDALDRAVSQRLSGKFGSEPARVDAASFRLRK